MAKTTTTAAVRKPTAQQAMLIKLATRKQGVTRAEVRNALGYEDGANIPVQTMLKNIAARHGYRFSSDEEAPANDGSKRFVAVYAMQPLAAAALKTRRAPRKS